MKENIETRDLKDGEWYWIDKAILHSYGKILQASGIAVYNALASFANSKTQACFPTQKALAKMLCFSRRTVGRKIRLLKQLKLIKVTRMKGSNLYYLLKLKVTPATQGSDTSDTMNKTRGNTNKNNRTRIIKNIDYIKSLKSDFNSFKGFKPKTREELLALDLAITLQDINGLSFYLSLTRKYPETLLRKVLSEVKEIPHEKIKKSRGALFNHLIQKYDKEANHSLSD